jgi:MoaA/NifB/PqqE/SkfB family radical SAM enzyme
MGTRYLNIHGGETLLRRDIGEIVEYIKCKGMYCCLITNGSLLHKKIDQIRIVDNLTISLDGRRENNDINRGKGTYDIALNAIKLALQEDLPLRVSATITKYTMHDIEYLAKLAKDLGFSLFFSILFKPLPQANDCEMTNEEIQTALKKVLECKRKGYPVFTSIRALEYAIDWPLDHNEKHFVKSHEMENLQDDFRQKRIKCYYGINKVTIEADGNVYPCFLLGDCFKPMNWRTTGIKKAIEHVQTTNDCVACPALSQNDHNLLLGLDSKQIQMVIADQIKEALGKK